MRRTSAVLAAVIFVALPWPVLAGRSGRRAPTRMPTPHASAPHPHVTAPHPQHAKTARHSTKPTPGSLIPNGFPSGVSAPVSPGSPGVRMGGSSHSYARRYGYSGYRYRRSRRANNSPYLAMQRRLAKLKRDLDLIRPGSQVSAKQTMVLRHDLMAVSQASVRPPAPPVRQLSTDLATALAHRSKPAMNTREMVVDLHAVMNAVNMSPPRIAMAIRDGTAVMRASGVQPAHSTAVAHDLQAVALRKMP